MMSSGDSVAKLICSSLKSVSVCNNEMNFDCEVYDVVMSLLWGKRGTKGTGSVFRPNRTQDTQAGKRITEDKSRTARKTDLCDFKECGETVASFLDVSPAWFYFTSLCFQCSKKDHKHVSFELL